VQLFEWTYDSVAAECPTLATTGYKYVQVSPAAEHIAGSQWWTSYQRVSAQLVSKHGNRDQLASMIATCSNVGVGVIVDVVLNHMSAGNGTGVAGSHKFSSSLHMRR
jgi:alpha-amylase